MWVKGEGCQSRRSWSRLVLKALEKGTSVDVGKEGRLGESVFHRLPGMGCDGEGLTMRWVPHRGRGHFDRPVPGGGPPPLRQDRLGRSVAGLTMPFLGNVSHTMTFVPQQGSLGAQILQEACARRFHVQLLQATFGNQGRWQRRFALTSRCLKEARNALPEARPHDVAES